MSVLYGAGDASNYILSSTVTSNLSESSWGLANLNDNRPWMLFANDTKTSTLLRLDADLGSSKSCNFCVITGHNMPFRGPDLVNDDIDIYSNLTTLEASIEVQNNVSQYLPTYWANWSATSDQDWRIEFSWSGTPDSYACLGNWWLGVYSTLDRNLNYGWSISYDTPRDNIESTVGHKYHTKATTNSRRKLTMNFTGTQWSDFDDIIENICVASDWGKEPIVIVPDDSNPDARHVAIYGRIVEAVGFKADAPSHGNYGYRLTVLEDVGLPTYVSLTGSNI